MRQLGAGLIFIDQALNKWLKSNFNKRKELKRMKKKQNTARLVILIFCMSLLLTPAFAADWPMWRNNASNTGASGEIINLPLTEKWHSNAPSIEENGAVVANGIVYMSTDDGYLYAFDVLTGFDVAGFPVSTGVSYGTPAVDSINGKVYVLVWPENLNAFNLDGSSAWTIAVGSVGYNFNEGPIIDEGYVYVKAGAMLQKYDAAGLLQWASSASGANTQPSIMGDHVYSNSESGQIQKFDKSTGAQIIGSGFPISTGSSMSALTTVNGKIFHKADILYAYDADDGTLLWSEYAGGNGTYYGSPAVSGGAVYVYGYIDGQLYAFDENTGATLTGFPSVDLSPGGARNWGSPTIVGDKIFIGAGQSQMLKVLGAAGTAQAGQLLAEYLTFSTDFQGFDLCSPVVSDGWVFAMLDGGGLYAFYGGDDPHSGALVINDDESCTESQDVTLALDNNDNPDVVEMRISEDPFFTGAMWEPYSETTTWTLSAGFGTKTVYAQLKDTFGQLSNVFTDQIDYLESCGSVVPVFVDIKPGSCPNPLNLKSKGVLPVAVLGTEDLDITTIDPTTIRLSREGVEGEVRPIRSDHEDVATPFEGELCDCHELNGDGYPDLTLKFKTQELVETLGLGEVAGETIPLTLTGELMESEGGTPIKGEDCLWVLDK